MEGLYFQKVPFSLAWGWSIESIAEGPWVTSAQSSPLGQGETTGKKIKKPAKLLFPWPAVWFCWVNWGWRRRPRTKTFPGGQFSDRSFRLKAPYVGRWGTLSIQTWPTSHFLQHQGPLVLGKCCFHFPTGVPSFPLAGLSAGNASAWTWCLQQPSFKGDLGI